MGTHSNYDSAWVLGGYQKDFIDKTYLLPRIAKLVNYVSPQDTQRSLLDLGCSTGAFLRFAYEHNYTVTGVDISAAALQEVTNIPNVRLKQLDLSSQKLPFESRSFDVVTAFDLVEHIKNPEELFREVSRVLKKEGIFYFITPNGVQPADHDETHFSLKKKKEWEALAKKYFTVAESYTYEYYPPPPYLCIQIVLAFVNQLRRYKIQQVAVIARKTSQ